jgi:hypothetical protein
MVALSTTNVVGSAILGAQLTNEALDKWQALILTSLNSNFAESVGMESLYGSSFVAQSVNSNAFQLLVCNYNCSLLLKLIVLCSNDVFRAVGLLCHGRHGSDALCEGELDTLISESSDRHGGPWNRKRSVTEQTDVMQRS